MVDQRLSMTVNKESHLYALICAKCPHCHRGDMFLNKNPYAFNDMTKMPAHCPVCGISFFPETGFYWGAMYISYVITVFFSAINVVVIGLLSGWNIYALLIGNALLLGLGFPLFFRFARVLWLQLNMPFSKEEFEKFPDQSS